MTKYQIPAAVTGRRLKKYFLEHVTPVKGGKDFYRVHTPLHAFKKAIVDINEWPRPKAVVNLIIPAGAVVYAHPDVLRYRIGDASTRKMRASVAKVHSVVDIWTRIPLVRGISDHAPDFSYAPGRTVKPVFPFSFSRAQCHSGIHFFLNVADAVDYRF